MRWSGPPERPRCTAVEPQPDNERCLSRRLTFELSRLRRQAPAGDGRTIPTLAWSRQTVAAVAGRRLSEGLALTSRAVCSA